MRVTATAEIALNHKGLGRVLGIERGRRHGSPISRAASGGFMAEPAAACNWAQPPATATWEGAV